MYDLAPSTIFSPLNINKQLCFLNTDGLMVILVFKTGTAFLYVNANQKVKQKVKTIMYCGLYIIVEIVVCTVCNTMEKSHHKMHFSTTASSTSSRIYCCRYILKHLKKTH